MGIDYYEVETSKKIHKYKAIFDQVLQKIGTPGVFSAVVMLHLECCAQFWSPQSKRDSGIL